MCVTQNHEAKGWPQQFLINSASITAEHIPAIRLQFAAKESGSDRASCENPRYAVPNAGPTARYLRPNSGQSDLVDAKCGAVATQ
jgi:hypothetical protein